MIKNNVSCQGLRPLTLGGFGFCWSVLSCSLSAVSSFRAFGSKVAVRRVGLSRVESRRVQAAYTSGEGLGKCHMKFAE